MIFASNCQDSSPRWEDTFLPLRPWACTPRLVKTKGDIMFEWLPQFRRNEFQRCKTKSTFMDSSANSLALFVASSIK